MTKMLSPTFGPVSSVFGPVDKSDKLSTGIAASYPILRIKGKVWSITRGGNDPHVLMRPDGDGPRNSIDVVIIKASQHVSKVWYEHGYEEGSSNPPDCFSANGVTPSSASTKKQSNACAGCPQNKWGSKITPAGKQAKACTDSRRIAVSPLGDIRNEAFGGPMLLRVPAASLRDFGNFGDRMKASGYEYYTFGTKMSFDPGESYPKLVLEEVRTLGDDEAAAVEELRNSEVVKAILSEDMDDAQEPEKPQLSASFTKAPAIAAPYVAPVTPQVTAPPPVVTNGFGAEPAKPLQAAPKAPKAKAEPKAVAAPVAAPPAEAAPVEETTVSSSFEDMLDAQLDDLMPESVK